MAGGIGGLPSFGPGDARPPIGIEAGDRGVQDRNGRTLRPGPGRAIRELPLAERPRERLALRGVGGLTSAELIGLLWGSGTRGRSAVDLAADALARHDGLTGLARATELELGAVPGVGAAKAAQLVAAFELGRRLLADWPAARWTIRGPHDVADRLDPADGPSRARGAPGRDARHEEPRPARRDRLPGQRVGLAGPGRRAVPRRGAAQCRRGDPRPQPPVGRSDARRRTTCTSPPRRSRPAGCSTSQLLDHLVIGHDAYVSLRDRGVAFDRTGPAARAPD